MMLSTLVRLMTSLVAASTVTAQLPDRSGSNTVKLLTLNEQREICDSGPVPKELLELRDHFASGQGHRSQRSVSAAEYRSLKPIVVGVYVNVYVRRQSTQVLTKGALSNQMDILNEAFQASNTSFELLGMNTVIDNTWAQGEDMTNLHISNYRGNASTLNLHIIESINTLKNKNGHCTFPPTKNFTVDGCVISTRVIPGAPGHTDSVTFRGKALIHLLGHWFGLWHTTIGGCDATDPLVFDIPASQPTYGCYLKADTCPDKPGNDPIHNYMGFNTEACKHEFSVGQAIRMRMFWDLFRAQGRRRTPLTLPILKPAYLGAKKPFYAVSLDNMQAVSTLCAPDRNGLVRVSLEKQCGTDWYCQLELYKLSGENYPDWKACRADRMWPGSSDDIKDGLLDGVGAHGFEGR
ncbi:putative metalloprotease MEP1 [Ophiocordyceps camponoti-floridani]|uniref:Putative metalloprotease MEP1 n=1 Tax=Ophiocordyceps camponoti-floridani TaxID=2030778 RepID=A0A8H4QC85_9HYPO|nr:putative metalloprotease MEP1 [Ophiocordyceps camponoti-floridani]